MTPWARVAIAAQIGWAGLAAGLALLLGALTSLGQSVLPDAVQPLANSASGWTLLTILVGVGLNAIVPVLVLAYLIAMVGVLMGVFFREPDEG